mmetsp:Transcript_1089/g.1655  ORF Transcript_1089/g.1655 Transcript_1089/m.1655 type:complete len:103 (+) Transcript_1089:3-311(+)
MLRRLKESALNNLPTKEEEIIEVELSSLQKQYYRALYEKNCHFLSEVGSTLHVPNLLNICMELRKCCNHPFLFHGVEEKAKKSVSFHVVYCFIDMTKIIHNI